jgi:hypothetical protein
VRLIGASATGGAQSSIFGEGIDFKGKASASIIFLFECGFYLENGETESFLAALISSTSKIS